MSLYFQNEERFDSHAAIFESAGLAVLKILSVGNGSHKNALRIFTDQGSFILKAYNREEDAGNILKEIRLLKKVCSDQIAVPLQDYPIHVEDDVCYIFHEFSGTPFSEYRGDDFFQKLGSFAGDIDTVLGAATETTVSEYEPFAEASIENAIAQLAILDLPRSREMGAFLKEGLAILASEREKIDFSRIRAQLLHRDIHPGNVLYDGHSFLLIDTPDMDHDYLPREIAVGIAHFLNKLPVEERFVKTRELLSAYNARYPLTSEEKRSLPFFVLDRVARMRVFALRQLNEGAISEAEFSCRATSFALRDYEVYIRGWRWLVSELG